MSTVEAFPPEQDQERTDEELRLYNRIQVELMKRYAASHGEDRGKAAMEWQELHSRDFFDLIKNRPDLLEKYKDDRDAALAEVESLLA